MRAIPLLAGLALLAAGPAAGVPITQAYALAPGSIATLVTGFGDFDLPVEGA